MADNKRIVLAYSGGLDTSVAISYLKERTGKDVVAVSLDVGQGGESLETIKQRALACGAVESYVVDARDEFANEYCMKALKANAMYEGVYPLVSAISRPLISKHLVRAAHQFGADTISHGCTGKGNDQVRFEVSIASIDPTLKAISPIRDLSLTRDVEIAFAKEHKLPITQTEKSPYSIDQNVWGRAVVTGRRSDSSLYDYKLATYDSGDTFDQRSSNGFIDIYGLPSRVAAARDVKFGNGIEVPKNTVE